jgi:hypothetical protein
MQCTDHPRHPRSTAQPYDGALFVALELSKSIWLTAVNTPGSDKMSKRSSIGTQLDPNSRYYVPTSTTR